MRVEIAQLAQKHGLPAEVALDFEAVVAELLQRAAATPSAKPTRATMDDSLFASVLLEPTTHVEGTEPHPSKPTGRYEDQGLIGTGGMGEVRRVRDRELNRTLAMKTMHPGLLRNPKSRARFVEEAQATAQLQHPNIVPIYDVGVHRDGRVWFTMKEIRGRTLTEIIVAVHAASGHRWEPAASVGTEPGWTFRRLVDAFLQVCRAVGYAHERGVVHRDLKPDNVMVGDYGEVHVVDWGLAKVLGRPDLVAEAGELDLVMTDRAQSGTHQTRVGTVSGTPVYMSPEQARGEVHHIDARSDVYGLGCTLYEILTGDVPFGGASVSEVLSQVAAGAHRPMPSAARVPAELVALCEQAMSLLPEDRFATAAELASELTAWLDGARLRQQALDVVDSALAHGPQAAHLRVRAGRLDAEATAMLDQIAPWEPEERKAPAWTKQAQGAALRRQADQEELAVEQGLHGALRIDASLPEAHAALAQRYLTLHQVAESERDPETTARAEALVTAHGDALPSDHQVRLKCAAHFKGTGALSLVTDPGGAQVELHSFVEHNRRLVPGPVRSLGQTPLTEVPVEMGSYLCVLKYPGRADVRYPVHIGRGEHWHGVAPDATAPHPVYLPRPDELMPGDCHVPAGWFIAGDPGATGSVPWGRLWCDAVVLKRFPVTNREYLTFLNDLVSRGRDDEAIQWAPRERPGAYGEEGAISYGRGADGTFLLVADAEGDVWDPDWPVFNVNWGCAVAFARWLAASSGLPWRLPAELEWEKAARGVDGRWFPWGDHVDPSWCCIRDSHPERALPMVVESFPVDESVYGVRGLGGNIEDWCADLWVAGGPVTSGQRVHRPALPTVVDLAPTARRVARGGYWNGIARNTHCAARYGSEPSNRYAHLGIRLARSL